MTSDVRIPRRPYLLRAMHQWITDSGLTPQIMVDATLPGVDVPRAHVREGRIVLNVSYEATRHLDLGNDWLSFEARFGGVARQLRLPVLSVQGIYARETGEGLMFPPEGEVPPPAADADEPASPQPPTGDHASPKTSSPGRARPSLKIVK